MKRVSEARITSRMRNVILFYYCHNSTSAGLGLEAGTVGHVLLQMKSLVLVTLK